MSEIRLTEEQLVEFEGLVGAAREGELARFRTGIAYRDAVATARAASQKLSAFVEALKGKGPDTSSLLPVPTDAKVTP